MSVSLYSSRVKQYRRDLDRARKRHTDAVKKVSRLQNEVSRLEERAAKTSSDSTSRSYLRQASTKEGQVQSARTDVGKRTEDVSKAEAKLAEAEAKLREAEQKERDREATKAQRKRRQEDQRERAERRRQEQAERREQREQATKEAARDREIDVLESRATELEQRLAEAERRAAPPEVTVLFLAANPDDQPGLRLDRETREIQIRFRSADFRDSIWFEWRLARQVTDLIQDLNEVRPDILHFSGHGSRSELAFEDASGSAKGLSNDQLRKLLEAAPGRIRLIVFNSCDSAAQAELAVNHVDVAIGMDAAIDDDVAKTFAAQLYNSLGFGHSVAHAFRQAIFQVEVEHGEGHEVPRLVPAEGVDPETVVLVNPD